MRKAKVYKSITLLRFPCRYIVDGKYLCGDKWFQVHKKRGKITHIGCLHHNHPALPKLKPSRAAYVAFLAVLVKERKARPLPDMKKAA